MTIQQIRYVIGIADTGSFNKASEQLFVSQPSLTVSVHELEQELGIQIFNRNGRGVSLTNDGVEFLSGARELFFNYRSLLERYGENGALKKKFGVSTQHYSFAVKSFVEMVKNYSIDEYEFAIRETKTKDVIDDVANLKSEIGILYLSDFNRKIITQNLKMKNLEFHHLMDCKAYVYIWKEHPLAHKKEISLDDLKDFPCLSFEQGSDSSYYYAEEILSDKEYNRTIKACDRATMLNLMRGLNGYTLCCGVISEDLNGDDYIVVPFKETGDAINRVMEIGYITKKNFLLNKIGECYIHEVKEYLDKYIIAQ